MKAYGEPTSQRELTEAKAYSRSRLAMKRAEERRAAGDPHYQLDARTTVAAQQCGDNWSVALPVYHMAMPLTADGNGPASPEETVSHAHEVWDQLCRTLCVCSCAEDAAFIANAVNSSRAATTT